MTTFYSSAQAVRDRTGVRPGDLGQASDAALTTFLEGLLLEVTDLIDRKLNKSYLATSPIPPALAGIAADIAADALRTMVATRQTPIVRIDDFAVRVIRSAMLSPDVNARLRLFGRRGMGAIWMTTEEL
ncbi:MAG TPA: hypothetical protein VLH81_12675 [Desulfobacterales bacterium]|nr:hypothetical protein [Desulfobacterales bacterium]